ncbi:nonribosomal siderophore peptide synthase Sid2 [Talaromyces proteolyticus]|uniref:Nonribosomal siderophore peptide synthase Sid2 n=1 Tax=Talaromyces proteolyticus TaxID=1131652 RepID=A0AAD4KHY0_9EURO|nr:nonribosomal siderophore peptide synthase Sid2 [Talaromyces proteolyticus]KAH8690739.1 nonribosomal siderophore peptide synthase Sid2 [Talaromyces proteolyticus]
MGYLHRKDIFSSDHDSLGLNSIDENGKHGFAHFKVAGFASNQITTPTGMREDILLLSWLIVLLRTQEDGLVTCDWAYKGYTRDIEHEPKENSLSTAEVAPDLNMDVEQAAAVVFDHIKSTMPSQPELTSYPASILLSTGSLSKTNETAKDDNIIHMETRFENDQLCIRPIWNTHGIPQFTVLRQAQILVDTIKMCISNPRMSIIGCLQPTERDLEDIWRLNCHVPPSYSFCMHDVITEQAQRNPNKVAISSWDGDLTYSQIDHYSTFLAHSLKENGVQLQDFVPVCFEKSKWTIVAVLAVMKSGATLVLMDPTLPLTRLQNMAKQVVASTIVTSRIQSSLGMSIIPGGKVLVVNANTFADALKVQTRSKLPVIPPSTLMYIIFTSGSTGTPKGVKISHENYTSSAIPRAKAVGYTEDSRVLDFASYAFDVSIDSMLLTLGNGGCLCIPSDEDRMNNINGAIREMQVNYAGLTPSVARVLDADIIASLSGLGLGGEAASVRDVMLWGQKTRIIIGYGPCECTIGCTVNSSAATGRDYISIGPGNGALIWIVDPDDHESLMPVGAVGELLVEGPIVGQGYLNSPEKTKMSFIENPKWLMTGHGRHAGRRGRLYKTGDLGKYDPDGSGGIVFAGRKDTQVKLRGQRVELGEIESQLKTVLPSETSVIAEVITPPGSDSQKVLVGFIASNPSKRSEDVDLRTKEFDDKLQKTLSGAEEHLANVLPRYMIPIAYIPINYIPVLISGKTDRQRLRQFGITVDLRQLKKRVTATPQRHLSGLEEKLRDAWSQALKLEIEVIGLEDDFFTLGGDSLTAMKLVPICREQGLEISVADIFEHPTLETMARITRNCNISTVGTVPLFSMITQGVESACIEVSAVCGINRENIEDIYPCTPTQESLFTFSLKSAKPYVAQRIAVIPSHTSPTALREAWEEVVAAIPIIRTRLVQTQDPGLQQVVIKEGIEWNYSDDLESYLENDKNDRMDLGQRLARYAIVENSKDGRCYMVWTVHHALYDGWSEPLVLKMISDVLRGQPVEVQTEMRDFSMFVHDTDEAASKSFWQQELNDAVGPQFPRLPSRDYLPTADSMIEHHITFETSSMLQFTTATLIRGAWAFVASQYTGCDDVVFGETLMGRDIPLPGVESIIGPLIATVPVRINVHRSTSVEKYLRMIQQGMLARTPYQHMGMQNIRKVSQDAQHACEAPTGLVIQPEPEYTGLDLGFQQGDVVLEALHFNPYPLMLACGIRKNGFRVCASFDSSLIKPTQMKRVLRHFETVVYQFMNNASQRMDQISSLPEDELDQIWKWNKTQQPLYELWERIPSEVNIKKESTYTNSITPWVCDARNPSLLSPIGCVGELWLEEAVDPGEIVVSPPWLMAGSSNFRGRKGEVKSTGDMVRLHEDGRLIFVGRKADIVTVKGHGVHIVEIESQLMRYLPPASHAAAAITSSGSIMDGQRSEHELLVFVEQQVFDGDAIKLLSTPHVIRCDVPGSQGFEMTICPSVSTTLVTALRRLDKFINDSLPSYMVPFAYVVVDKLPSKANLVDRNLLNHLVSEISSDLFTRLRESLHKIWAESSGKKKFTRAESILQTFWATILGIPSERIDVDDNFFRLGGDSVLAMKLVSILRAEGHNLTVADIFQHMRLGEAAKVLKVDCLSKQEVIDYKPFSTVPYLDIDLFLFEVVRPKLNEPSWLVQDAYPVTDSQALDIRGTIQSPRTSVQYTMMYFDKEIDKDRLSSACKELTKTHDILRTVFIEHDSTFFQIVLSNLEVPVVEWTADVDIEKYVANLCTKDIESDFKLGSSFFKIFLVQGTDNRSCLILGLSHALYDGISLPRLLRDLESLYTGGKLENFQPLSSYIAATREKRVQSEGIKYWAKLLSGSSLSVLQGKSSEPRDRSIFHTKPVDIFAPLEDITTASLLTASWALVLARRLNRPDVTFGTVTSGRNIAMANVEDVMGPCYQLTPVRILFESQWTAMDLLRFVQRQTAQSAMHDFVGFERISKECVLWSGQVEFFDSVTHHQDFEDFDTMPFAGGSCKVDIANPDGDATHPIKLVSYFRGGQMHVGVVGSERDPSFVSTVLAELAKTVQELASQPSKNVVLDIQTKPE